MPKHDKKHAKEDAVNEMCDFFVATPLDVLRLNPNKSPLLDFPSMAAIAKQPVR